MALSCQMQLFDVFENVSNISLDKMMEYVKSATTMCTFVYILVGFFGYVAFCTKPFSGNILLHLSSSLASDVIKIGFVLSVACSFPLMIFPCRASLYSLLYRRGHADVAHYIPEHRFKLITISLVSLALFVGILIPSIELIIGFVGSTIGVAICIMFPASCFIKVCQKNSNEKLFAQFMLIFGFTLMVLGTYANLSAIDEKSSGSFEDSEHVLKHVDGSMEQLSPEMQVDHLILQDVTPSKLEIDLKDLPDPFESIPKSPDSNANEKKYHEHPYDGLNLIELAKDLSVPRASDAEVKLIPLDVDNSVARPDDSKKSNDINNEAIQKEEQEIAIEKKEQNVDDSQSELKRLKETKKLLQEVKDMKNVLEKQNQETQQLVLQKFDEIVDKVEKIEKVQEEDNKKHEEEKAVKILTNEKKVVDDNVVETVPIEVLNAPVDKPLVVTNQTVNDPIISMLINKQKINDAESSPNNNQDTNGDSQLKLTPASQEEKKVDHVPIQRDLLNVNSKEETTDQSAANSNGQIHQMDLLRRKRDVGAACTNLNDERSEALLPENANIFNDMKVDLGVVAGVKVVGRDLKSVQDKR